MSALVNTMCQKKNSFKMIAQTNYKQRRLVKMYEKINTIHLLVFIIDACNYNCLYCYNQKPRSFKQLDLNRLIQFIAQIRSQSSKEIYIQIIGGEPTLHPDLYDFCKSLLKDNKLHILIYTNFSRSISYYAKLLMLDNVHLTLTYHSMNSTEFMHKLNQISQNADIDKYDIRIMVDPQNFEDFEKTISRALEICPNNTIPVPLDTNVDGSIQFLNNTFYTSYQLDRYHHWLSKCNDKTYFTIEYDDGTIGKISVNDATNAYEFNHFKYWKCNAGMEYMYIDQYGNVFTCITTVEQQRKLLHNIYLDQRFVLPTSPIICMRNECHCVWEVYKERVLKTI